MKEMSTILSRDQLSLSLRERDKFSINKNPQQTESEAKKKKKKVHKLPINTTNIYGYCIHWLVFKSKK